MLTTGAERLFHDPTLQDRQPVPHTVDIGLREQHRETPTGEVANEIGRATITRDQLSNLHNEIGFALLTEAFA
jgi:hypothetical protein